MTAEPPVSPELRAYLQAIPLPESVKCELCPKAEEKDGGHEQPLLELVSDTIDAVGRMWLWRCPRCENEIEMNFYPKDAALPTDDEKGWRRHAREVIYSYTTLLPSEKIAKGSLVGMLVGLLERALADQPTAVPLSREEEKRYTHEEIAAALRPHGFVLGVTSDGELRIYSSPKPA